MAPVILAGLAGELLLILLHLVVKGTPHTVVAVTQMSPEVKLLRKLTLIELVEELPVALAGNVQIYVAMFGEAGTVYVCEEFGHTENIPAGV